MDKEHNKPYTMVLATNNMQDRQGFKYISDIDINSIKFNVILPVPNVDSMIEEREFLLQKKLMS